MLFPGHNSYREDIATESVITWTALLTGGLVLFTITYLYKIDFTIKKNQLIELINQLNGSFLLQWPVLLALGVPSFLFILLRAQTDAPGGYWSSGLAYQFTPLLLALSFATMCIKTNGRGFLLIFAGFSILLIASGSRYEILTTALLAISAMTRAGVRLPRRTLIAVAATIALFFAAISVSRETYGRFNAGESFTVRLEAIGEAIISPENISTEQILDDTVYRFDGNSFGAMIMERQSDGYEITGLGQAMATVGYMIPSFLYRGKLDLEEYLRNEEGYAVEFYAFPRVDYMSDFWTLMLAYVGPWGLLVCASILGWVCAGLDNWLSRTPKVIPYIIGLGVSSIPVHLEAGFLANILDQLRTLVVLIVVAWLVSQRRRSTPRAQDKSNAPSMLHLSPTP
jgi:hypothetical protein